MASSKKQRQMLLTAYANDNLTRAVMDQISDNVVKKVLKEALRPWWTNAPLQLGVALGLGAVAYWATQNVWATAGLPMAYFVGIMGWKWWSYEESENLGILYVMWREDEERVRRLLATMGADERRITKALTMGARNSILSRIKKIEKELNDVQNQAAKLPGLLKSDEHVLSASLVPA